MDILGKVSDGVVVLKDPKALPDGTVVRVERVEKPVEKPGGGSVAESDAEPDGPSIFEELLSLAGTVKGLPTDFARNHDHYIHGTPKK